MSEPILDRRLTDFDWEGRKAAKVEALIDPHTHYVDAETFDTLRDNMDRYHVECVFLISPLNPDPSCLKHIQSVCEIGKDVIPYCRIDLRDNNPDVIQRAYDEGYWGIKFISPSHAYDDRFYDPLYERIQKLHMPILFHVGLLSKGEHALKSGTGMSLMRADMIDTISSRFPEILLQGAHLGNPHIADAVLSTIYSPSIYWDASGGCRHLCKVDPKLLAAPLFRRDPIWQRLMWATDATNGMFGRPEWSEGWPTYYEYMLAFWQEIFSRFPTPPSSEQLDWFFYRSAKTLLDKIISARIT